MEIHGTGKSAANLENVHVFDRRRVHFLRFGLTDQRQMDRSPALFRLLLDKSRDELKQDLSPDE